MQKVLKELTNIEGINVTKQFHPKVFVSHATEDKERFVLNFAKKLRNAGIDAWLDKWEIQLGDSLVDKIFEQGLKEANAIILILSNVSVSKPWVKEELNASFVAKVQKGTKLIPILIDDCEVPEALKSTAWERIKDLNDYRDSFEKVKNSIFGQSIKPKLGEPPIFVSKVFDSLNQIDSIVPIDNFVLKKSCEYMINNPHSIVEPHKLFSSPEEDNPSKDDVMDAIKVLESDGYFSVSYYSGGNDSWGCDYRPTLLGFHTYCQNYLEGFDKLVDQVAAALVNEEADSNEHLSALLGKPIYLIGHILRVLENNGLLKLTEFMGGMISAYSLSPKLKRALS